MRSGGILEYLGLSWPGGLSRRPEAGCLSGHTLPAKSSHTEEAKQRLVREGATQQPKWIFCYEMHFKHDLPHNVESISDKIWLKFFVNLMKKLTIKFILLGVILRKWTFPLLVFLGLIYLYYRRRVVKESQVSCIGRIYRFSQLCYCVAISREDATRSEGADVGGIHKILLAS